MTEVFLDIINVSTGETHKRVDIYRASRITDVPMRILDLIIAGRISIRVLNGWRFEFGSYK